MYCIFLKLASADPGGSANVHDAELEGAVWRLNHDIIADRLPHQHLAHWRGIGGRRGLRWVAATRYTSERITVLGLTDQ